MTNNDTMPNVIYARIDNRGAEWCQNERYGTKYLRAEARIDWTAIGVKEYLIEKCSGICPCCGIEMKPGKYENYPTIEHIIPLKDGGADVFSNLTITCRGCNDKGNYQAGMRFEDQQDE